MSAMTTQFNADVAAVEPEMPVTFVFNGASYTGQQEPSSNRYEMMDAGIQHTDDFSLNVRTAIFSNIAAPDKDDTISIANVEYRVDSLSPSQDGVMLRLHCVRSN